MWSAQALPKGWTQQEFEWLQALGQASTVAEQQKLLQQRREWLEPKWVERLQATLRTNAPAEAQAWLPAAHGLRIVADSLRHDRLKGATRLQLAILYLTLYELDSAWRWAQESHMLFRKANHVEGMAQSLHLQADILVERGELQQAIRQMRQALPLYQRLRNPEQQAHGELGMGRLYAMAGEPERALHHLQRAQQLAHQAKAHNLQAVIELTQGIVLRALGRFDEALQMHQQALELFRQLNRPVNVARQIANIGLVYWSMGLVQEARWHYQQAMPLFKELNLQQDVAICLMNTALLLQAEGELDRALETCQQALQLSESLHDAVGIAFCQGTLADILNAKGDYERALVYAERAVQDARRSGLKNVYQSAQLRRAACLHELKRYAEAERILTELVKQLDPVTDRPALIEALFLLGEGARRRGDWARARRYYERCLQAMERLHGLQALPPEDWSRAFQQFQRTISWIACAYAGANLPERAFEICQRGKGIGLRLAIESRRAPIGLSRSDSARFARLRQRWERAEQQLTAARTLSERQRAQRDYERALSDWSRARMELARRNPRYQLVFQQPVHLQELPLTPDTALIEYALTPKGVAILIVRREGMRNRVRATLVAVAESQLRSVIGSLYRWMGQAGDLRSIHEAAHQLYRWLVQPVASQLRGVRRVIVCPDGILHRVPWTLLRTPEGRYWTERVALVQVASASVWASVQRLRRPPATARPLMVALSQFPAVSGGSPGRARLAPLPGIRQERLTLSHLLGRSLQVLGESEASRARVLSALPRASQIHFATHAVSNPQLPLLSALALYGRATPEWLYAYEVLNLPLRARLVLLSACSTAGDTLTGDGLMGLAWAFLAAGCPSVVATLWKLPDEGVPMWTEAFYRALQAGQSVAEAVRQANLHLLKSPRFSHPRYWAGWILFGKD